VVVAREEEGEGAVAEEGVAEQRGRVANQLVEQEGQRRSGGGDLPGPRKTSCKCCLEKGGPRGSVGGLF